MDFFQESAVFAKGMTKAQHIAPIVQYSYTYKKGTGDSPVPFGLFAEQIVAPSVYRILLIPLLADAVEDDLADCEDQRIAYGNEAGLTEIERIGQTADLRPEPFEDQQRKKKQAEMQEKVQQPESRVRTVQCNFHGGSFLSGEVCRSVLRIIIDSAVRFRS